MSKQRVLLAVLPMVPAVGGCDLAAVDAAVSLDPPIVVQLDLDFTPLSLEVGDFDGDGNLDLLVGGIEPPASTVRFATLLGLGDGTFGPASNPGVLGCSAYPVVGRLTDDNRDDVVVTNCPGGLSVWQSAADATMQAWPNWPGTSTLPLISTLIEDVDGDGDNDLVRLRPAQGPAGGRVVDVFASRGGLDFWGSQSTSVARAGWSSFEPQRIALGDFDGQAPLDLAVTDIDVDVARLVGTPTLEFAQPEELGVAVVPWSSFTADMNSDGFDEIVVTSVADGAIEVLVCDGNGGFLAEPSHDLDGFAPWDLAFGDFNGDGQRDVLLSDDASAYVRVEYGDGAGGLAVGTTVDLAIPAIRVHARDLNSDGFPDVIAGTLANGTVTLALTNAQ